MNRQQRAEAYVRVAELLREACVQLDALSVHGPRSVPDTLRHSLDEPLAAIQSYASFLLATAAAEERDEKKEDEEVGEPTPALCLACGWVGAVRPASSEDCPACPSCGVMALTPLPILTLITTRRTGISDIRMPPWLQCHIAYTLGEPDPPHDWRSVQPDETPGTRQSERSERPERQSPTAKTANAEAK